MVGEVPNVPAGQGGARGWQTQRTHSTAWLCFHGEILEMILRSQPRSTAEDRHSPTL